MKVRLSDSVTIYHADCLEVLPGLSGVDLCLTDPPYNVGVKYTTHDDNMSLEEFTEWASKWFVMCRNVSLF